MSSVWKQQATSRGANGGDYELPPEGNQAARCVALVDIGTQRSEYQGKESWRRRVVLVWELVDATGKPLVAKDFTLSLHENAALRAWVDSWRGKPLGDGEAFDLTVLLGRSCYITISHKTTRGGKEVYAVDGVTAPPRVKGKEVEVDEPSREPVLWSVDNKGLPPEWLPFLYGRPLAEHAADSRERQGQPRPLRPSAPADAEEVGDAAEPEDKSIPF